jgi:hypothetical protein
VLAEDALERHRVRAVSVEPSVDHSLDLEQPATNVEVRAGAHHIDGEQGQLSSTGAFHQAQAAPGQSRIDSEDPHCSWTLRSPSAVTGASP